ncbi:hypothetical protein AB1Y20_015783 [Prymnesium parvum]|uniref:Alpha 1,4-glycosyltransferase domain-containing protein n=1 Tax=Prymnesium parvum TaxID=97485 RepID=A0AB34JYV9_PRYPA
MVSVRWTVQPENYVLYYDRKPPPSPQWRCACQHIATRCVRASPPVYVPGTHRLLKLMHRPDMMRLELLIKHGGIFLDHDAYVFRSLERLRRCCPPDERPPTGARVSCAAAPVVAGFEQATPVLRKLNPGVLLAERNSPFLQMIRASWQNYSVLWDYNCCEAAYKLHEQHPEFRAHLRADIGPLPRYASQRQYDEHLAQATVVHVTALSKAWRQRDLRKFGVMRAIAAHVISLANRSVTRMTTGQQECIALVNSQMESRWKPRIH